MTSIAGNSKRIGLALAVSAALLALTLALLAPGSAPSAVAVGTDCGPHADDTPSEASGKQLRRALGCLINAERAQRDRGRLRSNNDLTKLAQRHTKVMVSDDCFKHQCQGERKLSERIESSGYLKSGGRYGYGEILGCATTPASMVDEWMHANVAYHRKNILGRQFRHFGIGGKKGSPFPRGGACSPGGDYMTYTVVFGWRKRGG